MANHFFAVFASAEAFTSAAAFAAAAGFASSAAFFSATAAFDFRFFLAGFVGSAFLASAFAAASGLGAATGVAATAFGGSMGLPLAAASASLICFSISACRDVAASALFFAVSSSA